MALVLLVRHGQASFGAEDYDVLSETGWEQARRLGAHLAAEGLAPAAVVRGSMRRHRETTEALVGAAGWDLEPEVDPAWDEFDHLGVVAAHPDLPQGRTADRREFQRTFEEATARWSGAGPEDTTPYPETYAAFVARSADALTRATTAARGAGSGGTVLVVTSGGPIGAVAAGLVDPDDPAGLPGLARRWSRLNTVLVNSSVSRVVHGRGGTRLLSFNEHPHLDASTLTYR